MSVFPTTVTSAAAGGAAGLHPKLDSGSVEGEHSSWSSQLSPPHMKPPSSWPPDSPASSGSLRFNSRYCFFESVTEKESQYPVPSEVGFTPGTYESQVNRL